MAEVLSAKTDFKKIRDFAPMCSFDPKYQAEGDVSTNHFCTDT